MDGTVINGRWGEPEEPEDRWEEEQFAGWEDPYGYGNGYGTGYGRDLGMLTRVTVIRDRIVDVQKLPVLGSDYECAALELMYPPRPPIPPLAPQPAPHELQLAWLEQVTGGAEALASLDTAPLRPDEAEPDLSALDWPVQVRLGRILDRLDELAPGLLGPEGAIVARRIAVRAVTNRPGVLLAPDRDTPNVGALIHAAGKGNDLVGPTKVVLAKEIQRAVGLGASPAQRARAFADAVTGGRIDWPTGWHYRAGPDVLLLGGGDLLVSSFRDKLIRERDLALALRRRSEPVSPEPL